MAELLEKTEGFRAPVLHLDFEEEHLDGNRVKNVVGDSMHGEIVGAACFVSGPTGGSAIRFDEKTGKLVIADAGAMAFGKHDEFTVDFWYRLDKEAQKGEVLFEKGDFSVALCTADAGTDGVCWCDGTGRFRIGDGASREKWHHITVAGKNDLLLMYLDGVQVNATKKTELSSDAPILIGGEGETKLHGCIDDFAIYDYAVDMKISGLLGADGGSFSYTAKDGTSVSLVYRVYYPTDYDPKGGKKYPLMFFLHGHGECGTNNKAQLQVLNKANKFLDDLSEMDNCIILAPQTYCDGANNISEWVASGSHIPGKHIWDGGFGGMKARSGELSEITYTVGLQAASALLDEFLALDTVDLDRVYIGGISMGGCGTWEMIARRPETFAAAVPVCGSAIVSTASRLTNMAIWAFHGKADGTVLAEGSELICHAINEAGGHAVYTGFDRVGHDAWNHAYNCRNAEGLTPAEWVLKQKRK